MKMKNNFLHKQEVNLPHFVKTKYVHVLQKKCKTCTIQSFYIFTLIRFALILIQWKNQFMKYRKKM